MLKIGGASTRINNNPIPAGNIPSGSDIGEKTSDASQRSESATDNETSYYENTPHTLDELSQKEIYDIKTSRSVIAEELGELKENFADIANTYTHIKESSTSTRLDKKENLNTMSRETHLLFDKIKTLEEKLTSPATSTVFADAVSNKQSQNNEEMRAVHSLLLSDSGVSGSYQDQLDRLTIQQEDLASKQTNHQQEINDDPALQGTLKDIAEFKKTVAEWSMYNQANIRQNNAELLEGEAEVLDELIETFREQRYTVDISPSLTTAQKAMKALGSGDPAKKATDQARQDRSKGLDMLNEFKGNSRQDIMNVTSSQLIDSAGQSKYGQVHTVTFQADNFMASSMVVQDHFAQHRFEKKGVDDVKGHAGNIESVKKGKIDPSLKQSLEGIPKGDEATLAEVKPTKITLLLHGETDGSLSVFSPSKKSKSTSVSPDKMGKYIANHLPKGDYKGKLTIALRSCYGGHKESGSLSSVEIIAKSLKKQGYKGIKLTANKYPTTLSEKTVPFNGNTARSGYGMGSPLGLPGSIPNSRGIGGTKTMFYKDKVTTSI